MSINDWRPFALHFLKLICVDLLHSLESEIGILRRTEKSSTKSMCGVQLKDRRANNWTLILGFIEAMGHLAVSNSVRWYGNVLRRDFGHILRMAL